MPLWIKRTIYIYRGGMETLQKDKLSLNKRRMLLLWLFLATFVSFVIGVILIVFKVIELDNIFSDFAEVFHYCLLKNPYDGSGGINAYYPPLSFLLFYPFMLICKSEIKHVLVDRGDALLNCHKMPLFMLSYLLYWAIHIVLIFILLKKIAKLNGIDLWLLFGITTFCGAMYMLFYRGNVLLTAFLFVLLFYYFYKSEKRWQKELALVFLSLAIIVKIYVAVLGVILLKDKKWKDILKLGAYTLLFGILPFVFIKGNMFDNIKLVFNNYTNFSGDFMDSDARVYYNNVVSVLYVIVNFIVGLFIGKHSATINIKVMDIIKLIMIAFIIVLAFLLKKNKSYLLFEIAAIIVMSFVLTTSFSYILIFAMLPFLTYINKFDQLNKTDLIVTSIFFFAILNPITYMLYSMQFIFAVLLCMFVYSIVRMIVIIKRQKQNVSN